MALKWFAEDDAHFLLVVPEKVPEKVTLIFRAVWPSLVSS